MNDPTPADIRRIANREKRREEKQRERARKVKELSTAAMSRNPGGYVVPDMPAGLSHIRKWVRDAHNAYSRRDITPIELTEIRRTAATMGDLYRTSAELRKGEAAIRAAIAQESMTATLASVEHGGAALLMLSRLQDGLAEGKRRPLPARVLTSVPTPTSSTEGA
jgi:hypothetical protein